MLEKISKPEDVKKLSFRELSILADEIRQRIISVTSINGGHVAPSLGATDFIIALLKVFNIKEDNIIFDVGHQAYAYKILTERNDRFDTLRTLGGISGFNNIFESQYDSFTVGHASTSISATLGIHIAKQMLDQPGTPIAVIGDGAMTGGMAFEALNHLGHLNKNMIVVLNDNEMSISANVGALQNYMTNVMVSRSYNSVKKQVWDLAQSLPTKIKDAFISGAQRMEGGLMKIVMPNSFFEALGFKYVGPINGHDIPRMCRIFRQIKENMVGPVLVHLLTTKGKGVSYAETDSSKYHGIGPFDHETGLTNGNNDISWSNVFGNKLVSLAGVNKKIVVLTAAMTDGTGLACFAKKYPDRLFDVGIAEQHAVTLAAGMASKGLRPFIAIYSSFLQRAFDQVIHDVALQKLPVIFCIDRAGIVGEDGATHQGVFDLSYLQMIPNITIIAPASDTQMEQAMDWAMRHDDGPIAIRYPRGIADKANATTTVAGIVSRQMSDTTSAKKIAISGVGHSFRTAKLVYEMIVKENLDISTALINPYFIKPFDSVVYDKVYSEYDYHIVIEENVYIGGFASRLSIEYQNERCKTVSFAIPDDFIPHGSMDELREICGLTAHRIYKKVLQM
jgi:1-deoxy-D-xylulose-5-phosphate synthase